MRAELLSQSRAASAAVERENDELRIRCDSLSTDLASLQDLLAQHRTEAEASSVLTSCSAIGMTVSGADTMSVFVLRSAVTVSSRSTAASSPGRSCCILATRTSRSIGATDSARARFRRKVRREVAGVTGPASRLRITDSTRVKIDGGPETMRVSLAESVVTETGVPASVAPPRWW